MPGPSSLPLWLIVAIAIVVLWPKIKRFLRDLRASYVKMRDQNLRRRLGHIVQKCVNPVTSLRRTQLIEKVSIAVLLEEDAAFEIEMNPRRRTIKRVPLGFSAPYEKEAVYSALKQGKIKEIKKHPELIRRARDHPSIIVGYELALLGALLEAFGLGRLFGKDFLRDLKREFMACEEVELCYDAWNQVNDVISKAARIGGTVRMGEQLKHMMIWEVEERVREAVANR